VERRLAATAGVAIVIAGTLLHFVYGWSGQNALAGLVSPVNESVWEHTKLLVVPVVVAGAGQWRLTAAMPQTAMPRARASPIHRISRFDPCCAALDHSRHAATCARRWRRSAMPAAIWR
jgi:hypothetical protein